VTDQVQNEHPVRERLQQENRNLLKLLLDREREVTELNGELAETNKGVVPSTPNWTTRPRPSAKPRNSRAGFCPT
jgi:hypothetical protein